MKAPSVKTLAKYGLVEAAWWCICASQGLACGVCKRLPTSGRLNVDHEHVKNWSKMTPHDRRKYVRGLLCYRCNRHFASKGMTVQKALALAEYLRQYESRKAGK